MYRNAVSHQLRYRFQFDIVVKTPLHIGGGKPEEGAVQFLRTGGGAPYIPGSSIKGMLRAHLYNALGTHAGQLLGREVDGQPINGGKLHFHDAGGGGELRIAEHVALDPVTRTASDKLLYSVEYAPLGTRFRATILGPRLAEEELQRFAGALLEAEQHKSVFSFAAGYARDWGQVTIDNVVIEKCDLAVWLAAANVGPPSFQEIAGLTPVQSPPRVRPRIVKLSVLIEFDGPVLVKGKKEGNTLFSIRNDAGEIYLPGSSIRGAIRAQAARIWRTISMSRGRDGIIPERPRAAAIRSANPVLHHPFHKVFGAAGWRSPIQVPDFDLVPNTGKAYKQTCVSIDRFTGGGAPERLFAIDTVYCPKFRGVIQIDLARLESVGVGPWALALGLFLLRDWMEGDIPIGSGSARGFGGCKATAELPPDLGARFVNGGQVDLDCPLAEKLDGWINNLFETLAREEAA